MIKFDEAIRFFITLILGGVLAILGNCIFGNPPGVIIGYLLMFALGLIWELRSKRITVSWRNVLADLAGCFVGSILLIILILILK